MPSHAKSQTKGPALFSRIVGVCLAGGFALVLGANVASRFLENSSPQNALRLNPLNTQAHINRVVETLSSDDTSRARAQAENAISTAPADGRTYSLLGAVFLQENNLQQADPLFAYALLISDAEQLALRRNLAIALAENKPARAVRILHILTIRWPDLWPDVAQTFQAVLATPDGLQATAQKYKVNTRSRRLLFNELRKTPQGAKLAAALLLELQANGTKDFNEEVRATLEALVKNGDAPEAQNLFLFTLDPSMSAQAGFLFNGSFDLPFNTGPFNWKVGATAGTSILKRPKGVEIQFVDAPTKLNSLRQTTTLFSGNYQLSVALETRELRTARPLTFSVVCNDQTGTPLARLQLPQGDTDLRTIKASFRVPEQNCDLQTVFLSNGTRTIDWEELNSGSALISQVSITQQEAAE